MNKIQRCDWVSDDPIYIEYHDKEWGVPVYDDRTLFEFLILEGTQAGLAWITVLKKRENYRLLLDDFDPEKIACYDDRKTTALFNDKRIIRNRLKINMAIRNAQAYLKVLKQYGTFSEYIWGFVDGEPIQNVWENGEQAPVSTPISGAMSKDLKRRGFNFVGPTICYSYMQAVGMVNDHLKKCFRYHQLCEDQKLEC